MFDYIQISKLNDFIFCPKSIYFHEIYSGFEEEFYHQIAQKNGKLKHQTVDNQTYSSSKDFLIGLKIFSDKFKLIGKIDIYDSKKKQLIERKAKVKKIYDGYRYQLYAQYFCLLEMGYEVESLKIHSLEDNKNFSIDIPNNQKIKEFEDLIRQIQDFEIIKKSYFQAPKSKCDKCIYKHLCHD